MAARGLARTATWLLRLLQLFFCIILMGIVSYMIHQFRKYGDDDSVPDELIVSEVAVRPPPSIIPLLPLVLTAR